MATDATRAEVLRVRDERVAIRAAVDGEGRPTMFGHAAVFNVWTEIDNWYEGHFLERISPKAFNQTLKSNAKAVRCLFRHGWDPQIGDKVLGAFSVLRADDVGLYYEVPLYPTSYNADLEPGLADGQYGASFRAQVVQVQRNEKPPKSEHNPNGLPEVTYTELALRELGPCTFGAYPEATSALRSLDDLWPQLEADPAMLERFLARATDLRTRVVDGAAPGTPDVDGAASNADDEPARSHSGPHPDVDYAHIHEVCARVDVRPHPR